MKVTRINTGIRNKKDHYNITKGWHRYIVLLTYRLDHEIWAISDIGVCTHETEPTEMAIQERLRYTGHKACGAVLHKCYAFGGTHKYQVGRGIVEKA